MGIRHARIKKKGSLAARTAVIIDLVASAAQKAGKIFSFIPSNNFFYYSIIPSNNFFFSIIPSNNFFYLSIIPSNNFFVCFLDAEIYLGRCDANFDNFRQW